MSILSVLRLDRDRSTVMKCQDNLAFMRPLADESMKLIVTSPPYNIGKSYEARTCLAAYVKTEAQVIVVGVAP